MTDPIAATPTELSLPVRLRTADSELALPSSNEDMDEDNYRALCDCGQWALDVEDNDDNLCRDCWDLCHFRCERCQEEFHIDDRSEEFPDCCAECGADRHTELIDGLLMELDEETESWDGGDDEIELLLKLVAYAKRLTVRTRGSTRAGRREP